MEDNAHRLRIMKDEERKGVSENFPFILYTVTASKINKWRYVRTHSRTQLRPRRREYVMGLMFHANKVITLLADQLQCPPQKKLPTGKGTP